MFIQMYEEKFMRFPGGREKALTFSYDDGVQADVKLLDIFGKYGLKGAFNLNNRLFDCQCWHGHMDEEQTLATFKNCGQEIALHGARHIFLNKVPLAEAVREIADNRAYLEQKFERIVDGMAYAYSAYNEDIIRILGDLGVQYARTTSPTYSFDLPKFWLKLNPTCHHADPMLPQLLNTFLTKKPSDERKHREPWLFFIWGHSYEFDDNDNWDIIRDIGVQVHLRQDIWCATPIEIRRYVKAYEQLEFSIDGERVHNPGAISVWIEARGKTYEIPAGMSVSFDKPE